MTRLCRFRNFPRYILNTNIVEVLFTIVGNGFWEENLFEFLYINTLKTTKVNKHFQKMACLCTVFQRNYKNVLWKRWIISFSRYCDVVEKQQRTWNAYESDEVKSTSGKTNRLFIYQVIQNWRLRFISLKWKMQRQIIYNNFPFFAWDVIQTIFLQIYHFFVILRTFNFYMESFSLSLRIYQLWRCKVCSLNYLNFLFISRYFYSNICQSWQV